MSFRIRHVVIRTPRVHFGVWKRNFNRHEAVTLMGSSPIPLILLRISTQRGRVKTNKKKNKIKNESLLL